MLSIRRQSSISFARQKHTRGREMAQARRAGRARISDSSSPPAPAKSSRMPSPAAVAPSRAAWRKVPLFARLTESELELLEAAAVARPMRAGEAILREGDVGETMYLIQEGSVQIHARAFDGSELVLMRLEPGEVFGELALLPGGTGRRNASARAFSDGTLLELGRGALEQALAGHPEMPAQIAATREKERRFRDEKLRGVAFAGLGVSTTDSGYRHEHFGAGETVFREGDPGERVYLLLRGTARVRRGEEILAELLPGQFFGELAILHDAPRAATVEAGEELEVVSLDGGWFRAAHRENPTLRDLMASLSQIYLLPHRGLLTLQTGSVEGQPTVTAIYHLPDGRRVVTTRISGHDAFTAAVAGAGAGEVCEFSLPARSVRRRLEVLDGRLVRLECEGEWTGLGRMFEVLLDGQRVEPWQLALFAERGGFEAVEPQPRYESTEVICACTRATCGQILAAIREGAHSVDEVRESTRATLVCGGCAPLVKELLGRDDWTPALVTQIETLLEDVRAFQLRPARGGCRAFLPGQHVVLQARIDGRWVQRAYTLSSAGGAQAESYEITVKREPKGVFSRWLFERHTPDALLRVSEPGGHYLLPESQAADVVCLVSGIGLTPALAMARELAGRPRDFRLHIDCSVSAGSRRLRVEELAACSAANPRITTHWRVTGETGRLDERAVRVLVETYPGADFYLCGSEGFLQTAQGCLRACGVPETRIKVEVFLAAGGAPPSPAEVPARSGCPVAHGAGAGVSLTENPGTPLEQAEKQLRQCYAERGVAAAFPARWQQVEDEFRRDGTFVPTTEEVTHLARVAWRNSTRCIGRMYWEGMALRDFRQVRTDEDMLDALLGHIEFATNGGNLRPALTLFRPQGADGRGPRVWSPQLFRYAGYRQPDGTVLGDPANLGLTDVALALGWQPPQSRGAFDLLPLIVQSEPGRQPSWREIPQELVLEVPITHPDFPWFAEFGLKWYALPAVSSMRFDAAGLVFSAAPFNGWYMGTEIGARNFGDIGRYNLLPAMARKMGLDTSNDRTLWRDRALVELNVAVLASYEAAGVTMMDHHAASHSFDKFEEHERAAGRPVHARWNWLVPPISGSAVTVFHRDSWEDIQLLPAYVHQADPWLEDLSWKAP